MARLIHALPLLCYTLVVAGQALHSEDADTVGPAPTVPPFMDDLLVDAELLMNGSLLDGGSLLPGGGLLNGTGSMLECGLKGSEAVDHILDSAVYLWAAANRCGKPGLQVKCEIDVSQSLHSLLGVATVILKTVAECGDIQIHSNDCVMAVGELSRGTAALAAASGGLASKCHFQNLSTAGKQNHPWTDANCVVDLKGSFKSLFNVLRTTMDIENNCGSEEECVHNSLKIVAAVSALGEFLAGAVGHCTVGHEVGADCASEVMALIHHLDSCAMAGHRMSRSCKLSETQDLFIQQEPVAPNLTIQYVAFVAIAVLPIASVLSFFAGARFAKSHSRPAVRELESLVPMQDDQLVDQSQ